MINSSDLFGSNYKKNAIQAKSLIKNVVVYSDRAKVEKKATINGVSGKKWIVFKGLPVELNKKTILVSAENEKVKFSQIIIEDSYEHVEIESDFDKIVSKLDSLYSERLEMGQRYKMLKNNSNFLHRMPFSAPFSKSDYNYKAFEASLGNLNFALEAIRKTTNRYEKSIDEIDQIIKKIDYEISFLRKKIIGVTNLSKQKWLTNVFIQVSLKKKMNLKLSISYMIKSASWRPVYDVRADLNNEKGVANINFVTAGLIEQHTGEQWSDVFVTLSTLSPEELYLPRFNKWVFTENRVEDVGVGNSRSMKDGMSYEKMDMGMDMNMEESSKEREWSPQAPSGRRGGENKLTSFNKGMMKANNYKMKKSRRRPQKSIRRREMKSSSDSKIGNSTNNYEGFINKKNNHEYKNTSLFPLLSINNIYPEFQNTMYQVDRIKNAKRQKRGYLPKKEVKRFKALSYSDSSLPAVQAKGRLVELKSPFTLSLKHDEAPIKIPLKIEKLKGKLKYFTIPKKNKLVFLSAKVLNTSNVPILMGKTQIFMNGDLVSKSSLSTILENQFFDVHLGVDHNIETKRIVSKKSKQKGVVFKEQKVSVDVKIEIVNNHNFAINIEVKDNYPKTPNNDIEIALKDIIPKTKNYKYGVITWNERIEKKSKKIFSFSYDVNHPSDFIISELN